ncbi:MAG: TonB-dependent siderophore receptor, partial [Emcibacteraceae bacterium]|nr:TonB-dependent siderophore receptor [Emcibacteraceae bacterium]
IVTKKPQFDQEGTVALTYGRWNTVRVEGDYTNGLTDNLAFRINGAYEKSDGFRDFTDSKSYTVSPSLLFNISESTSVTYEGEFVHKEVPFDRGTIAIDGELGLVPRERFFGEPGDGPNEVNVTGHQVELKHELGENWGLLVGFANRKTHMDGFSSDTELSGGRQQLYQDGETLMRQRRFRDYQTDHTVIRAEISGTGDVGGMAHHLMVGADYEKLNLNLLQNRWRNPWGVATQDLPLADVYAINIFDPVYGNATPAPLAPLVHNDEDQKSFGIYVNDQVDITDKLKLRVGGRYDDFSQEIFNVLADAPRTPQDLSSLTLQAGLVYEVSDDVSIYSVYGEGFRPNSGTDFAGDTFDAEETTSYEVGVKFQNASGSLNGTVSGFYMEKTNIITADPVNSGFTTAAGDARSKGIEVDLNGLIGENFRYLLSYAYIDAEFTKGAADKDFIREILAGDPLINVPKHSGSVTLIYDATIGDMAASFGTSAQFVGTRLGQTATDYMLPSYELVKIFASIEPIENFRLTLTVDNLFDTNYWPQSYGDLWTVQGRPRTYSIRGAYTF